MAKLHQIALTAQAHAAWTLCAPLAKFPFSEPQLAEQGGSGGAGRKGCREDGTYRQAQRSGRP